MCLVTDAWYHQKSNRSEGNQSVFCEIDGYHRAIVCSRTIKVVCFLDLAKQDKIYYFDTTSALFLFADRTTMEYVEVRAISAPGKYNIDNHWTNQIIIYSCN